MISFVAVVLLSFVTLCAGTWIADRFEQRRCATCGLVSDVPSDCAGK